MSSGHKSSAGRTLAQNSGTNADTATLRRSSIAWDGLRDRDRLHAILTVRQQAALAAQFALKRTDLQRIGRARREALLGRAGAIAYADHVLWGKAQR